MNALFMLGHPAHFHLFKHTFAELKSRGHNVVVASRHKDILANLLESTQTDHVVIGRRRTRHRAVDIVKEVVGRELKLFNFARAFKADILVGTSFEITHTGRLLRRPSIVLNEDDVDVVPHFARSAYPFATAILSPEVCRIGKWERKKLGYAGYQKLAYLHPNRFVPDPSHVRSLSHGNSRYFLIRWVSLDAHHDSGIRGLQLAHVERVIKILSEHGNVFISAEKELPDSLRQYALPTPVESIHHVLHYADLLVGDSQSMSVEAAVLGTPNLRFNDFVGRISVLEELQNRYQLTEGIPSSDPARLFSRIAELLDLKMKSVWRSRREKMLKEKIDITGLLIWLLEEFPQRKAELQANPSLQYQFQ